MTTAAQDCAIDDTARAMGIPEDSVASLFAFIDGFRMPVGEGWERAFPTVLIERAHGGDPWAVDVVESVLKEFLVSLNR